MAEDNRLESRTIEIGSELFEAMKGDVPSFFDQRRWKGKVMDWTMKDERFKVQLFRFIDALPSLKSDCELLPLLIEYFYGEENLLPGRIKGWLPKKGFMASMAGKIVKTNVESLAKQFIAGRTPKEALGKIARLRGQGRTATVDLLGEAVLSDQEAYLYIERYLDLIDVLTEEAKGWENNPLLDECSEEALPKVDVSLKISSFYARLDPMAQADSINEIIKPLRLVLERTIEREASVTFDMEHYRLKDITLAIFKEALRAFPNFSFGGIAIQAYLKETETDLNNLIDWARKEGRKINVRLVKGAYWDYEKVINVQQGLPVPVFLTKAETDLNFERLTRLLLENSDVIRPAIASHNIRSIAYAMATGEAMKLKKSDIEFQALYGMAEPIKNAVTSRGYRVREYLPVGEFLPGMAYLVRRLLENTSNESFLRLSFVEKLDFKNLMATPVPAPEIEKSEEERTAFQNLPLLDFSKKEERDAFTEALAAAKERFDKPERVPLVIGGEKLFTEEEIVSLNPANPSEQIGIVSSASEADAERAIEAARAAWSTWRLTPPKERAKALFKAAEWMNSRRYDLSALQVFEVGKGWKEADADVAEAIDFLNYYGREAVLLGTTKKLGNYPGELNQQVHLPRGVAAVIAPWNFPLAIACGMTAAAIATGNAAILKPSSLSPLTTYGIFEAFEATGLPKGVLQFLPGPGKTLGNFLVENPGIDIIAFTGSKEVGLGIIERAGKTGKAQRNVKKVIAEMGGKNAIIVDKTADLDEAIKGVIASFTGFQGQKCSACSRVIVVGEVYNDFLGRLTEAARSLTIGPPEDPANKIGPMIDEEALAKVNYYVGEGKKEATLHYQFEHVPGTGYYAAPAIFTDVTPDCRIATEEIFGPVLAVMLAGTID